MRSQSIICEEADPVLLYINPNRTKNFLVGVAVKRNKTLLVGTLKLVKIDPYLGETPLIDKNFLVNTRKHQVPGFSCAPRLRSPKIRYESQNWNGHISES